MHRYAEQPNSEPHPSEVAFEELWHRYQKPLSFFVTGLMGYTAVSDVAGSAEDAVQEIMLKVHRGLNSFDGSRSLSGWVYAIARNHCIDLRRRRRTIPLPTKDEVDSIPARRGDNPEQRFLDDELKRTVDTFMSTLTEENRSILFLRFFEELPYAEIAEVVGRPEGTVRYRIHELKQHLRDYLEERQ